MRENWLSKLQSERKLKGKIKIDSTKKIRRKKIGLEILEKDSACENLQRSCRKDTRKNL